MENDNKDENHVDNQENDMTNNSKEEEEKTVQNAFSAHGLGWP
jgi:hypothetical protein